MKKRNSPKAAPAAQKKPRAKSAKGKANEKPTSVAKAATSSASGPGIVGIGASAGGLEAFGRLLSHLAPHTGLAYVLVQHLAREHESLLPQLLGRATTIPVVQASDGIHMEADHAYVIPPNTTMTVTDGRLHLVRRPQGRGAGVPPVRSEPHLTGVVAARKLDGAGSSASSGPGRRTRRPPGSRIAHCRTPQ